MAAGGLAVAGAPGEVFRVALRLGLTSFGGPIAHLGYFREEYVVRRRWLDDARFAELVALTNLLPGPSSSQLGIAVGTLRAGKLGGLLAWLGFTLPSAVALTGLALVVGATDIAGAGWLHGLELAAAAVVLAAVISMARTLARGPARLALAAAAAAMALLVSSAAGQTLTIVAAGLVGMALFRGGARPLALELTFPIGPRLAWACLTLFFGLLLGLPVLRSALGGHGIDLFAAFYRAGALVFGGGHVVLPLLDQATVASGWVGQDAFLAGYGAAQAVPGPLFAFSAYLGAIGEPSPNGVAGAAVALAAIFLPSFLLLGGVLPLWSSLRERAVVQAAVAGVGAGVVGLLAAALWDPVLQTSVDSAADGLLVAALFALLRIAPAWVVVAVAAAAGALVL